MEKKRAFDEIINLAKAKELEKYISITEEESNTRSSSEGKWSTEQDSRNVAVSGSGDITKIEELKALEKAINELGAKEGSNYLGSLESFNFQFKLSKGDKLPKLGEVSKVFQEGKVTLQHIPGEVLLIDVWATWCGPCQKPMQHNEEMLKHNKDAWKGKARIVAVSVDDSLDSLKDRINQKDWKSIEHLTLGSWDGTHDVIKLFGVDGIPFVCLIDKNGIIDYVGHPSGCKLEERINQLIAAEGAGAPAAAPEKKESAEESGESSKKFLPSESWDKIEKALKTLPEVGAACSITVTAERKRTFKNGVLKSQVSKPKIDFTCEKEQSEPYTKFVEEFSKSLSADEFTNRGYVKDTAAEQKFYAESISKALKDNGFASDIWFEEKKYMDLKQGLKYEESKKFSFGNIPYTGEADMKKGEALRKYLEEFAQEYNNRDLSILADLMGYPFTLVGNKFAGVGGLKSYKDKSDTKITHTAGQSAAIIIAAKGRGQEHVEAATKLVNNENGHLHIIIIDDSKNEPLEKLAENPNVSLYYGQVAENAELKVLGVRSYEHTVLINKQGTVVFNKRWVDYDKAFKDLDETKAEHPISAEVLKVLEGLPTNEVAKKVNEALASWDYPARVTITFKDKYPFGKPEEKQACQLEVEVAVRTEHKAVVQPLIDLLGKELQLTEEYVKTVQIPVGDKCVDCAAELKFPYYYYHWSKSFRCRACGEKQDAQLGKTEPLKRYAVNESAVLLFKQSTVDEKRLGTNLQPKTNEECQAAGFMCNGCNGGSNGDARYICMGCRREPNPRDYVDYCLKCVNIFTGPQGEELTTLLAKCKQRDNHPGDHPLLRTNYSPEGYYKF